MKSRKSLLVGVPTVVGLVLAGLNHLPHAAHAAPPPPIPLVTVTAASGYYQQVSRDSNPGEDLVVAVKDRTNNPITNATVTFTSSSPAVTFTGGAVATLSSTATNSGGGFYILPAGNVTIGTNTASIAVTLTATATVPAANGTQTVGTATFTLDVGQYFIDSNPLDAASIQYVYSPATNPSVSTPPVGGVGSNTPTPPLQSAPVNTVYPFKDEVQVLNGDGTPVSGASVAFAIANTDTPANPTPNAQFTSGGQTYTAITDSEGIATSPPVRALQVGAFVVTASITVTSDATATISTTTSTTNTLEAASSTAHGVQSVRDTTNDSGAVPAATLGTQVSLTFNYVVTAVQTSGACQLFIGAFTAGGGDSISLRTGDQGPLTSLIAGNAGPVSDASVLSDSFLLHYPIVNYLTLGTAGGPGSVRAIPQVPRYLNNGTTTLTCTASTATGAAPQLITVNARLNAYVYSSSRAGVAAGDILTVTLSKTGYGPVTRRGLSTVVSESLTVQDTTGTTATTVFGGGSFSVAPQSFVFKVNNTIY